MLIEVRDGIGFHGAVQFIKRRGDQIVSVEWVYNIITDLWLNYIRDAMKGTNTDLKVKYMAWGTGTTAALATQVGLEAEVGRQQITSYTTATTRAITETTYVGVDQANVTVNEWGWFAGPSAGSALASGIMVARILSTQTKTNLETFQVDRTETLSRA